MRWAWLCVCLMWQPMAQALHYDRNPYAIGHTHTRQVHSHETLYSILRSEDIGLDEIIAANPFLAHQTLEPGTMLIIPSHHLLPTYQKGIVINLSEKRLYHFSADGIDTYPISIGQIGWQTPLGHLKIIEKNKNPNWVVPESIRKAEAKLGNHLDKVVLAGPDNPLGSRALRLSNPNYLIHGTNTPNTIGTRGSAGCIRMYERDIQTLYDQVTLETPVTIIKEPIKTQTIEDTLWVESVPPLHEKDNQTSGDHRYHHAPKSTMDALNALNLTPKQKAWMRRNLQAQLGIPFAVGPQHAPH